MQKAHVQDTEGDPEVAEAKLRVKKLQRDRWDEVKLTFVLPKEEEDKLRLQLEEEPDDEAPQEPVAAKEPQSLRAKEAPTKELATAEEVAAREATGVAAMVEEPTVEDQALGAGGFKQVTHF